MVKIIRQIVPRSVRSKRTYSGRSKILGVAVHETANRNRGANARSHANLQTRLNPRQASWQYTVDDSVAYQSFEDHDRTWHAGDGDRRSGSHYIAIEMCVNSDGDYEKTLKNTQELIAHLSKKHGFNSATDVKQHYDFSGKNCPAILRGRGSSAWRSFVAGIAGSGSPEPSKPSTPSSGYRGNSIVDYLNSQGRDSSFAARANLAAQNGIHNYRGTAAQNIALLDTLRAGDRPTPSGYRGSSIVDYLKSVNRSSSFAARAKLARKHGIRGYVGTAAQNSRLLKALRGF